MRWSKELEGSARQGIALESEEALETLPSVHPDGGETTESSEGDDETVREYREWWAGDPAHGDFLLCARRSADDDDEDEEEEDEDLDYFYDDDEDEEETDEEDLDEEEDEDDEFDDDFDDDEYEDDEEDEDEEDY